MLQGHEHAKMSVQEARDLLSDLAQSRYGTDRWMASFARETGVSRVTVENWFRVDRKPPYWALALLEAEARAGTHRASLTRLADVLAEIREFRSDQS